MQTCQMGGTCLYEMSGPLYLNAQREKKNRRGLPANGRLPPLVMGKRMAGTRRPAFAMTAGFYSLTEAVTLE